MKGEKLTLKQEAFCKAFVETGSASKAYRLAFDAKRMKATAVNSNAKKLAKKTPIALRIEELRSGLQKRHEISVTSLVVELEEARALALDLETPMVAVSATMGKAKLMGFVVDKNEHTGKGGGPIETKDATFDPDAWLQRAVIKTNGVEAGAEAEAKPEKQH